MTDADFAQVAQEMRDEEELAIEVYEPALFIEIGGNGWRARESSVESSCYTKSDSSPRSTPWVKRY
ncbi:hypothetical protein, partial [Rhodovulum sp. 12E13]|uniref:hypothetical protein n=1 Tax=Rhodovulum sp. 12E13 TaxID=2203891 RepID=UPI0011C02945